MFLEWKTGHNPASANTLKDVAYIRFVMRPGHSMLYHEVKCTLKYDERAQRLKVDETHANLPDLDCVNRLKHANKAESMVRTNWRI